MIADGVPWTVQWGGGGIGRGGIGRGGGLTNNTLFNHFVHFFFFIITHCIIARIVYTTEEM